MIKFTGRLCYNYIDYNYSHIQFLPDNESLAVAWISDWCPVFYYSVRLSSMTPCSVSSLMLHVMLHFLDNRLTDGGEVLSLTLRPSFAPMKIPGTHFCYRMSRPQGHRAAEWIRSIKKSSHLIGNRTCDFPVCSTVPQPTMLQRSIEIILQNWCVTNSRLYYQTILLYHLRTSISAGSTQWILD
jgi:hypothetical protein